jgi:nucleoside diphosphate kinase
MKMVQVEQSFAEKHYSDLSTKPFFGALVEYIISGPVIAMVWQGKGVVATGRKIIGATNPAQSEPGTIRGDFCIEVSRFVVFFQLSKLESLIILENAFFVLTCILSMPESLLLPELFVVSFFCSGM